MMNDDDRYGLIRTLTAWQLEQIRTGDGPSPMEQVISTCNALRRHAEAARFRADTNRPEPAIFLENWTHSVITRRRSRRGGGRPGAS